MSKVSSYISFAIKKLWTLVAIVLVTFALLISLLRYSLPLLNDQKGHVERYISQHYGIELNIEELSADWTSAGPSLVLRGVNIAKGEQSPIELLVTELFVEIDFWSSLKSMSLQSRQVMLNKLELEIELNKLENTDSEYPIVNALEKIFLEQLSDFSVTNSMVTINTAETSKSFEINKLSWLNNANRHQGVGEFDIDSVDDSVTFVLDLYGDLESYSGTLYAQATDIDASIWINEYSNLKGKLTQSKANAEVWAIINNGEIKRIDGEIKPSTFAWKNQDFRLSNAISANFAAIKQLDRWDFSVDNIRLTTDQASTVTAVDGHMSFDGSLFISARNPIDISSALPITGLFSIDLADKLALASAQATVEAAKLSVVNDEIYAKLAINDMKFSPLKRSIGIENLDSLLLWHDTKGMLVFNADSATLTSKEVFSRDKSIKSLKIPVFVDIFENTLSIVNGNVNIDSLQTTFDMAYHVDEQFLSLHVDINELDVSSVPQWLPNHFMGDGAKSFLTRALTGEGKIERASVLWHGLVADKASGGFPFNDNEALNTFSNGVFQSTVAIKNADFLFSEGWPELKNLDIDLNFENLGLTMSSSSSQLGNVSLKDLSASIDDLSRSGQLTIEAFGQAQASDVADLMLQSTLKNTLGKLLKNDVVIEGEVTSDLALYIPLDDGASTRAVGDVYLRSNTVNIPSLKLQLNDTNGAVSFNNATIAIEDMQAELLGQTFDASLQGQALGSDYKLNIEANGLWASKYLAPYLGEPMSRYFGGKFAWNLNSDVLIQKQAFEYEAFLNSDLVGLTSTLPEPFNKRAEESKALSLTARGNQVASSIDIMIPEVANFDGAFAHKERQFNRAHLAIGPTEFESRGVGFSISADFPQMDFPTWYTVIESLATSVQGNKTPFLGLPQRIFIDTDKLTIFGETLSDVDLTVKRQAEQWTLDLDADQVRSTAVIDDNWFSKGVSINAEYVRIGKVPQQDKPGAISNKTDSKKILTIDPKTLPLIDFTCKSCVLYGVDLGRVEIEAEPNDDGLRLNQILIDNSYGSVNSSGQWYKRNQDHFTFIAGDLFSRDFGEFLQQLGFDSGIQDSSANMTFALTWTDSPLDLDLANLDGQLDWRLSDGYLTEVSDKGSRIFTLLSLNSLVRKLSLDFRDVFAKGFFYDNMQGSVQITQGKADTRDTNIDGAAGEIEIYGYTDLASKELNYNVSFAPNVTGNLPVLVYFFTVSPPSALAALAIDQVLSSAKVISNVNYLVSGTIDKPVLTETGRESTEVELPARSVPNQQELDDPDFIPPTKNDLLQIEVNDG